MLLLQLVDLSYEIRRVQETGISFARRALTEAVEEDSTDNESEMSEWDANVVLGLSTPSPSLNVANNAVKQRAFVKEIRSLRVILQYLIRHRTTKKRKGRNVLIEGSGLLITQAYQELEKAKRTASYSEKSRAKKKQRLQDENIVMAL